MRHGISHRLKVGLVAVLAVVGMSTTARAQFAPYCALGMRDPGLAAVAIYGRDGALWGFQGDFSNRMPGSTTPIRWANLMAAGVKDPSVFQERGIYVDGNVYAYQGTDAGQCIGRKRDVSVLVGLTAKALVIGVTKAGVKPSDVTGVRLVLNRLKSLNF